MRDFVFIVSYEADRQPSVMLVQAIGEVRARELAQRILAETPRRNAVEVWEDGKHLFTVDAAASADDGTGEAGA